MSKKGALVFGVFIVIIMIGIFAYQYATDEPSKEMTKIPEQQHDEIPLFNGLKPTDYNYIKNGNHLADIYQFYINELPKMGWDAEEMFSALDDNDPNNDWGGFYSRWENANFEGELILRAQYNQSEDQTVVVFHQRPILVSSIWIEELPKEICIYKDAQDSECIEITEQDRIHGIVDFIHNEAYDFDEEPNPRKQTSIIDFGNFSVSVHYEGEEMIYFESNKGIKQAKPDPDFFELVNLPLK